MRRGFAAILAVLQEIATKSEYKISAKRRSFNCAVLPYRCLQMPIWPSAGQILQDQHKDQHMYGIKGIAGILERLAVIALPSSVQARWGGAPEVQAPADRFQFHADIWTGYSRPPSSCTLTSRGREAVLPDTTTSVRGRSRR